VEKRIGKTINVRRDYILNGVLLKDKS
jgi:hypothetical protein